MRKIYWHWTATGYDWALPNHYHIVIGNRGAVKVLHAPEAELRAHTFGRNANSTALAIACMGGNGWGDFPPQLEQIETLCRYTAKLAKVFGYKLEDINHFNIMTHAEAAANRDFPLEVAKKAIGRSPMSSAQANEFDAAARQLGLPHCNYGPTRWHDGWPGGYAERWDLAQLKKTDKMGTGGFRLRERTREIFKTL